MKRGLFFFGLILWTVFSSAGLTAAETQKLKIIYSSFTGAYTPLWIAVDDQLGRKHGLELEAVYAGRARPHQLLLSGDAQYVVSTGTGVVSSYAAGQKDMVIIASFLNVTGASLFTKPQISKPAELRGKVVGSGRPGSITDVMLHYVLKKKLNLDPARDVKVVPLGDGPAILPALEKGVVDGAVLTTPTRLMARAVGFREMLDFDELGIPYPYVGVSTLKANVKKRPDVTVSFLKTLTEAIQIFKTNREKSMAVMKKYLRGASDEILAETYNYFSAKIQKTPYPSADAIRTALDMMSDQFPQAKSVDPNEVIDMSFLK
ncbi:MAG: ABC transporter substrate-binding protein [Deltaproteobacteria bacterium]|nr:ABC transporter substrate-binding protein [Deltaproteobacteria bacterium]MDZ4343472.1 ABC transporter substrate-binding protein [Candidatus Binatia bacterium]